MHDRYKQEEMKGCRCCILMFSLHEFPDTGRMLSFPRHACMIPDVNGRRPNEFAPGPDYVQGSLHKRVMMCYIQESEATMGTG